MKGLEIGQEILFGQPFAEIPPTPPKLRKNSCSGKLRVPSMPGEGATREAFPSSIELFHSFPFIKGGGIPGRAAVQGKILATGCDSANPGIAPEKRSVKYFSNKGEF